MKRIATQFLGVDQGSVLMFSDFRDGGPMWNSQGEREVRRHVDFTEPFRKPPVVMLGISLWDVDNSANLRADLLATDIDTTGFNAVFRTWDDSRIARIRMSWTAIGPLAGPDDWDI